MIQRAEPVPPVGPLEPPVPPSLSAAEEKGRRAPSSFSPAFWLGSVDLAPVGLFRIGFGLSLLSSVLDVLPVLPDAFTDEGFLPRSAMFSGAFLRSARVALMDVSGPVWVAYGYWIAAVAACVCFTVGYRTPIAKWAAFVLVAGLIERNLMLCDSSDDVDRLLLFWSLFVPVGNRFSVDAVRARARGAPLPATGHALPIRIVELQIAWIYLCTFLRKLPGKTWHDGTAVHVALGLDVHFTRPLGHLMFQLPWSTAIATYATLAIESTFLVLVFLPFWQPRAKAIALIGGFGLHAGIWLTMCIGGFSWVMLGAYPIFFEPRWAEAVVRTVERWLDRARASISWLPQWPAEPVSSVPADAVDPAPRSRYPRALRDVLMVALFALCVWSSAPVVSRSMPKALGETVQALELWQEWSMFAPDPDSVDSWLRGPGKLIDGTEVDVLRGDRGGPMPPPEHAFFASRWTSISDAIARGNEAAVLEFGKYLCRHWNADRPAGRARLGTFQLHRMERVIPARGTELPAWHDVLIWDHVCGSIP